jgi:hypothetical protein
MVCVYVFLGPVFVCEMTEPIPLGRSLRIERNDVIDTIHSMFAVASSAQANSSLNISLRTHISRLNAGRIGPSDGNEVYDRLQVANQHRCRCPYIELEVIGHLLQIDSDAMLDTVSPSLD